MFTLLFSFFISLIMVKLILFTNDVHYHLSHDHDLVGVQKYHEVPVPRIGGMAIFVAFLLSTLLINNMGSEWGRFVSGVAISVFFIFLGGITEDLTKDFGPFKRVAFMSLGTFIAIFAVNILPVIYNLGIPLVDSQLKTYYFTCLLFTVLLVVGVTNSFNLIDGYHGISSFCGMVGLLTIATIAYKLGCIEVYYTSLTMVGAILGFFIYNYPRGKLFLGDGGAYLIGFSIAVLGIYLSQKYHDKFKPLSLLLIVSYPVIEVLFTIYRRRLVKKVHAMRPDQMHLHQLIYHRCLPLALGNKRNCRVLPRVLPFILPQALLTVFFNDRLYVIAIGLILSLFIYIYSYIALIKFRTPWWLFSRKNKQ